MEHTLPAAIEKVSVPEGRSGAWAVERFNWQCPQTQNLPYWQRTPSGKYTRLVHDRIGTVMADSEPEMRDHIEAVPWARGRVLINGLGLGMVLGAILAKPDVERVTVVEVERNVIELVGPYYACDRLETVCASAFDYEPAAGTRFNAVWHDIWPAVDVHKLTEMLQLRRKYAPISDWQGCWAEDRVVEAILILGDVVAKNYKVILANPVAA
jgi:hypothetical protein